METPKEFLIEWLKSYTGLNTQSIYDLAKEVDNRYTKALQLQQTGVMQRSEQLVCDKCIKGLNNSKAFEKGTCVHCRNKV